jgi:phospho-N-acetylmuramoyl-pentapeptide-transferase
MQIAEVVKEYAPPNHRTKSGTPTMGGVMILMALLLAVALWGNFSNPYVWLLVFVTLGMGAVGFVDDYRKVVAKNGRGLSVGGKFFWQALVALTAATLLYVSGFDTTVTAPFFKNFSFDPGVFYIAFAAIVVVASSNAVNLTDGLDGLAIGPVTIAAATYLVFAYLAGHIKIANYLLIPYVQGAGELTVFAGAMVGASLGFLWFNAYPAQVFMGDVGSLALGAGIGMLAVVTKNEILLVLVGGIFVVEALSVIFQVASLKFRGKRILKMAPIHHHFELKGWPEPRIIVRFWIIAIILSLVAISTLKIR